MARFCSEVVTCRQILFVLTPTFRSLILPLKLKTLFCRNAKRLIYCMLSFPRTSDLLRFSRSPDGEGHYQGVVPFRLLFTEKENTFSWQRWVTVYNLPVALTGAHKLSFNTKTPQKLSACFSFAVCEQSPRSDRWNVTLTHGSLKYYWLDFLS